MPIAGGDARSEVKPLFHQRRQVPPPSSAGEVPDRERDTVALPVRPWQVATLRLSNHIWIAAANLAAFLAGEAVGRALSPAQPERPGQKVAPCDSGLGQAAINGNCWVAIAVACHTSRQARSGIRAR